MLQNTKTPPACELDKFKETLWMMYNVLWTKLEKQPCIGQTALNILKEASCLAYDYIPFNWMRNDFKHVRAFKLLKDYGLIVYDDKWTSFKLRDTTLKSLGRFYVNYEGSQPKILSMFSMRVLNEKKNISQYKNHVNEIMSLYKRS